MPPNPTQTLNSPTVRDSRRYFLRLFIPASLLLAGIVAWGYRVKLTAFRQSMELNQAATLAQHTQRLTLDLNEIASDALFLAQQRGLQDGLEQLNRDPGTVAEPWRVAITQDYLALAEQKQRYDQIRVLDLQGKDVIRVTLNDGQPTAVPEGLRPTQADPDWLQAAQSLQPGEILISPLDHNIEPDTTEQPLKPIIRMTTAVFDRAGQRQGWVVLNYLGSILLEHLATTTAPNRAQPQLLLVDANGFWLQCLTPEGEWGFVFADPQDQTFGAHFPAVWAAMAAHAQGHLQTPQGHFTFARFSPLQAIKQLQRGDRAASLDVSYTGSYPWTMVSYIPADIHAVNQGALGVWLLSYGGGVLLLGVGAGLMTRGWARNRRFQLALQASEHRHRTLANALPDLIIHMNREGVYLDFFNPIHMTRFDDVKLGYDFTHQGFPSELAQQRMDQIHQALATGKQQIYEQALVVDSTPLIEEVRVVPVTADEVLVIVRDISERKQLEAERKRSAAFLEQLNQDLEQRVQQRTQALLQSQAALQKSEADQRKLFDASPIGLALCRMDGKLVYVNAAYANIIGCTVTEALTLNHQQIIPTTDTQAAQAQRDSLEKIGRYGPFEQEYIHKNGSRVPVRLSGIVIEREGEKFIWSSVEDIRDLKQAEKVRTDYNNVLEVRVLERTQALQQEVRDRRQAQQELLKSKEAAETANRAKSDFLANMSHELRTPLNGILGYAQVLSHATQWGTQEQQGVEIIYQCGNHLLTLINDVLDLAKIEAQKLKLQPEPVYLATLVDEVTNICRIQAEEKGITFTVKLDPTLPQLIYIDEKRLRQVLFNLLGNGVKFTPQGTVSLRVDRLPAKTTASDSQRLRFAVCDTGVGIEAAQLAVIFRPFEQVGNADLQTEGTGLGLTISQRIVALMGGQLQVRSQVGQGSIFWFEVTVPVSNASADVCHSRRSQVIQGYRGPQQSVLVVDDQPDNRAVWVNLLEPLGFTVAEAANGEDALTQMRACPPEVIIVDLIMPGMDGYELLKQIRAAATLKWTIAIAASASVFERNQQQAIAAGADAFLAKPVQRQQLLDVLQQYLALDWIYGETQSPPFAAKSDPSSNDSIAPPQTALEKMLSCVHDGDIQGVVQIAEQLLISEPAVAPFAQQVLQLARGFELAPLQTLIERYLA